MFLTLLTWITARFESTRDDGFSTAELLGNAALGIAALVVIWQGLSGLGADLLTQIRASLGL